MTASRFVTRHRIAARRAVAGPLLAIAIFAGLATTPTSARAATGQTVVSLTFDDGSASEYWALGQLQQYNMLGTFYINSAHVGTSAYFMNWSQVHDLYNAGNEIGGHTALHVNLPQTDPVEAKRQICDDRVNLLNQGFQPTDFAYPFGAYNSSMEQMAAACGYDSARTSDQGAETIPPQNPYAIRVSANSSKLSDYENAVLNAESQGGGWVPLVFHQICNACDANWITQSDFTSLLAWLQGQAANGVVVKRVQDVIGGSLQPAVPGPAAPAAPNGWNVLRNASLEYNSTTGAAPDCFSFDSFGNNNATWSLTSDAHSGSYAERVDITNYTDGDTKLLPTDDLGRCTPSVTPGHQYVLSVWYKSSVPVTFDVFNRDTLGAFSYWTTSPAFPAASAWQQAVWTTPVVPNGVTGMTFGPTLASSGSMTVDDFGFRDAAPTASPDTTPPSVSITSPANGSTVAGTVSITANASDNVAVDHLDYLVDGTVVSSETDGFNTYSWYTRSLSNGAHTIAVRAVDPSGNATTTSPITVFVSNSLTNLLQNPSLETASGSTPTCWLLGGYGTNSFTWTRTTDAHSGSYAENLNVTSYNNGDRKLLTAQDSGTCAPAVTPGHSYNEAAWYKVPTGSATPRFFAYYRNSSGNWVYWTQSASFASSSAWKQATWLTPPVPSGATNLSVGMGLANVGSVTMDDFSLSDNSPPPDTTPPTSTITCDGISDGGGCASGWYDRSVLVTLTATDNPGGSGVASIIYTTDGSNPTPTNGTVYTGPFTVTSTTTVKWRAYDNAGKAEAIHTQAIQVDKVPPSSMIQCNGTTCQDPVGPSGQGGWYNTPVSVSLSAVDSGGSGVADIRYTTDGSDPTTTNGKDYVGPFSVTSTATVKYQAYDNAGNAEAVNSQAIQIDTTPPDSTMSCNSGTCQSGFYNGPVSVSLSATDGSGSGVAAIYYTTDGSTPTATSADLYSGAFQLSSTATVKFFSVDNAGNAEPVDSQTVNVTPPGVTLTSPTAGATVSGTTNLTAAVSGINAADVDFFVDGQAVGSVASSPFTLPWDSTSVPNGTHTIVASAFDASGNETDSAPVTITVSNTGGDTTPPTSTIACNGGSCSGWFGNAISVSLSATDSGGSGVASIVYTTDGSDPSLTNGSVYSGPFSIATTTTVKFRAYDNAGNAEAVNTQYIQVDTVAPSSSISCNGTSCASSFYNSAVSVSLSATDNTGGSGVASIVYTTDGSTPSTSNGTTYTGPLSLNATTTVKYRAYDNAGNAEPVNSALIRIDTTPPTSTIACNGGPCSGWFGSGTSVSLSATDNSGGSGVASIRYTTDGSTPTLTNGTRYSGAFSLNRTTTVNYRSYDNAGNAEAVNTQAVQVDGTPPSVSLTAPSAGLVSGAVSLSASASDNVGVDHVDFLVDGNVVGTVNSDPYTFSWNSATVPDGSHTISARAVDLAGNRTTSSSVTVTVASNNLLHNASLESASGSIPSCWGLGGYGTNTFTWTRTTDAHSGSYAENLNMTSYTSGDRKFVNTQDAGTCAPAVSPGHSYTVTAWYKVPTGSASPEFFAYYRNSSGSWVYWAASAHYASSATWTLASWTTPVIPAGATNLSIGMGLDGVGSLTMDDFGLFATG
jgi:peptidoglycan/xylan/chitin deacetylase (PgdA/CDA1 family)/archaellum component FlaF (FlaF/FlaG flagellin family)